MKVTTSDLANAIGISQRAIVKRAKKEKWQPTSEKVRGGGNTYELESLPKHVQQTVIIKQQTEIIPEIAKTTLPTVTTPQPTPEFNRKEIDQAGLKASLLNHYNMALATAPWGKKVKVRDEFIIAYNSGIAWPHLFKELGPLSWKTLDGWAVKVKKNGNDIFHLADRRGHHLRGKCSLTDEQTDIFLRSVLRPNQLVSEAIRVAVAVMKRKGFESIPSEDTFRRWLDRWKSKNYDLWVWAKEGKSAWNDKCAMYIQRDYSLIQVGDIVVADGHSLNFEIRDLVNWTGGLIVLIGEQELPHLLKMNTRSWSRTYQEMEFEAVSHGDIIEFVNKCTGLVLTEDAVSIMHQSSGGDLRIVRRDTINLAHTVSKLGRTGEVSGDTARTACKQGLHG